MNLADIGQLVAQRRRVVGLSQDRLARLSGLSRATVHQLEAGTLRDLGAAKLMVLLDLLGLRLDATPLKRPHNALRLTSQTVSVSYKHALAPGALASALVNGSFPSELTPQMATLLDEAPMPLIVATVEEVAAAAQCPAKTLWKHLFQWAQELQSPRPAWS